MEENKQEKLSYEQLESVCHSLSEQSRTLYQQLKEANLTNVFKRLDYLFKVIDNEMVFPEDFVKACIEEIVSTITIPSQEESSTETEEKAEE